jgi:hypothetical protein
MNDNIITWTPTNWVTVFLMAAGGFFILGFLTKGAKALIAARTGGTPVVDNTAAA